MAALLDWLFETPPAKHRAKGWGRRGVVGCHRADGLSTMEQVEAGRSR